MPPPPRHHHRYSRRHRHRHRPHDGNPTFPRNPYVADEGRYTCLRTHISACGNIYVSTYAPLRRVGKARQGERSWRRERCKQRDEGKKAGWKVGHPTHSHRGINAPSGCTALASARAHRLCIFACNQNPVSSSSTPFPPRHATIPSLSAISLGFSLGFYVRLRSTLYARCVSFSFFQRRQSCRATPLSRPSQRQPRSASTSPLLLSTLDMWFPSSTNSRPSDSLCFTLCFSAALQSLSS